MKEKQIIKNFTDLVVWKEGHILVLNIYKVTIKFPKSELYSLTDQLRRSVVSITSNIAEGFGRNYMKEKIQFYYLSQGSLYELQNQLIIARDLNYISNEEFLDLQKQIFLVCRLLSGLIKSSKSLL